MDWVADSTLAAVGFIQCRRKLMSSNTLPDLGKPNLLLAKSFENGWKGSYSLVGHTADIVNAITTLVDILGEQIILQFALSCTLEQLRAIARLAAYLHDWGKANHHFQMMVRKKRHALHEPQMIRHEALSTLLAIEFREWLDKGDGSFLTAVAAAGGHHLKFGGKGGKITPDLFELRRCGEDQLYLYTSMQYLKPILKYGVQKIGLPHNLPAKLRNLPSYWTVTDLTKRRLEVEKIFGQWEPDIPLVAVVKSLLIAADAIGSASAQTHFNIHKWMKEELQSTLTEADLQKVIDARRKDNKLRPFQVALGKSIARVTMARAGCGTGKTLGAYNWAKTHAIGRKLFFCYPTTGTSTEGFLDYVQDEVEAVLLHSRAEVDLEMAQTGEEEAIGGELTIDEDGKPMQSFENEAAQKLSSFKAWGPKVSVCTVDTVLGLMQCNRRPLYCFPAIAQAAFVFDEVHCYDDALFGALLKFLETVKAPVLLMSASFLPWQIQAIETAVGESVEMILGPKDLEEQPRYRFQIADSPDWEQVKQELAENGKVLWVCNQVNVAIEVYQEAKRRNLNAVLYHSRYRYADRVRHHREVVDGFGVDRPPILAIATQVAEMSLDLSATLLISQISDPAGAIQRLGRLNRVYCGHPLKAIFYPPKNRYPYKQSQLDNCRKMIEGFSGDINQAQLATWLENSDDTGDPQTHTVLLDGKWRTYSAPLRNGGFTVTALLEEDLQEIATINASEFPKYTVPLDARKTSHWKRHKKGYLIAPSNEWKYCPDKGAQEVK
jgi:CRISPR-associated endonuclease/helicase Cas3